MDKFSIVCMGANKRDIAFLVKELKGKNLIAGTEKDIGGDTVYITHNLQGVKKVMEEYDGLMLDVHRNR